MDVSIIIVNYNTLNLTKKSIDSVFAYNPKNIEFEVIVVDNASTDGSKSCFEEDSRITYIYSDENLGFGRANNIGIKRSNAKYVFLLNSDAYLVEDVLTPFYNFMELPQNKDVVCCGANVINSLSEDSIIGGNLPSVQESIARLGFAIFFLPYYRKHLASGVKHYKEKGSVYEIGYVTGADMFLRKSVLDNLGAFDPSFFLYYEETEMSFRFKKNNFRSVILSDYKLVHDQGSSSKTPAINKNIEKIFSESRYYYFQKCYGIGSARFVTFLFALQSVIFGIFTINKNDFIRARIIFKTLK